MFQANVISDEVELNPVCFFNVEMCQFNNINNVKLMETSFDSQTTSLHKLNEWIADEYGVEIGIPTANEPQTSKDISKNTGTNNSLLSLALS